MQINKFALKWNIAEKRYYKYGLPDGATVFTANMYEIVNCADCGKKMIFGEGYMSTIIHTKNGTGYCVCIDCYNKTINE